MPSLPDIELKKNAAAAGEKIKEGAKVLAHKSGALTEVKPYVLKLDREPVEILPGGKAEVKVSRSGGDMKALQLELIPAPGSKLAASGGEFKAGESVSVI